MRSAGSDVRALADSDQLRSCDECGQTSVAALDEPSPCVSMRPGLSGGRDFPAGLGEEGGSRLGGARIKSLLALILGREPGTCPDLLALDLALTRWIRGRDLHGARQPRITQRFLRRWDCDDASPAACHAASHAPCWPHACRVPSCLQPARFRTSPDCSSSTARWG